MPDDLWVDLLNRKHECYPTSSIPIEINHEGKRLTLHMPDVLVQPERLEIKATVGSGELLVLIGRHTMTDRDDPYERGVLMVARKRDEATYDVHVWHEMYPYALKYLGLAPEDGES
ncbi:MAG: hypothetical protein ABI353_06240 [Isosphaeraceae bacterium]